MSFVSIEFPIFLAVVFFCHWILPKRFQWIWLLCASCFFYMSWNAKYILLILFTTIVSYSCALGVERMPRIWQKRALIIVSLIACLSVLFLFKYYQFTVDFINSALDLLSIPQIHPMTMKLLLPVGISFYTFQTLGYVFDVYRGEIPAERHFGKYALFVTFFPQLVAGPIERSAHLLNQLKKEREFDYARAVMGMRLILWGLFKKVVIADSLAYYADRVFEDVSQYGGAARVLAALFFTIQIYCDFSGYSDIAIGSARLFGVELMQNFRNPYFSVSIRDFWNRWHVSLSTWFRDYLYIPLGGNKKGEFRRNVNTMITFLISGLWHGANVTFIAWGGLHGLARVMENSASRIGVLRRLRIPRWVRCFVVFAFCSFAWVIFRIPDLNELALFSPSILSGIQHPFTYFSGGLAQMGLISARKIMCMAVAIMLLVIVDLVSEKNDTLSMIDRLPKAARWLIYYFLLAAVLLFWSEFMGDSQFVYFQF